MWGLDGSFAGVCCMSTAASCEEKTYNSVKEMLAIASYFVCFLLFQVTHQSLHGGSQLLDRAARPSLRQSSSLTEASAGKKPVKPTPTLNDCPICLESFNDNTYWKLFPCKIQVKRWPGCAHGYHPHCYKEMVDQQQPCAICRKPCPPLSAARLKRLESRPRVPPSEPDQDETAALEVLQTDLDLAELVPEIGNTRGDGASTSGSSHTHEGASVSARIHEEDEALARALSFSFQQEARHHPGPSSVMFDERQYWGGQDTSADKDLALALSLQEEFIRDSQGGNSGSSIQDALPQLAELSDAWSKPDTSRDGDYARQIERELNEQRPLPPRSFSQGHPQPATTGYPQPMHEWSARPRPQAYPQLLPPGYRAPSMHQEGYLQPAFCFDGACGPNQPIGFPPYGAANYQHQSMAELSGGSPDALQSFQRGMGQFQPASITERIHDVLPQVLLVGLVILMYYTFFRCENC
ncbi:hypothetical protein VP01_3689g1 [Puccinia sorghi]|uniref:RING-type domain-containing protein n=1 Tax=Puccinia sorghi TaxID=27349 RepID=A0A0L6UU95_9BASI|nr:hypothetical protein VP01_3689g1 [Puccinia sorghi]